MRVIVIEDEIRIREGISKLLGKMGEKFDVVAEAEDGKAGLALCLEHKPDIIITDIRMPDMDGLEMLAVLKEQGVDFNAIVISAFSEFEYAKKAISLGVTEYLLKPISVMEFRAALENVENKIIEKRQKKPEQVGTLSQLLGEALDRDITVDPATEKYLRENYHIDPNQELFLVCVYLGNDYDSSRESNRKKLERTFTFYKDISYIVLESRYYGSLITVIYNYQNAHDIELWIQHQILRQDDLDVGIRLCAQQRFFQYPCGGQCLISVYGLEYLI